MYSNVGLASARAPIGSATEDGIPSKSKASENVKKEMWSSMLESVASGKRLPEKSVIVLGGTPDSQRDFLELLSGPSSGTRRPLNRNTNKLPPVANQFALGYTYQDLLDTEQDDVLARLSYYLLTDPSPSFAPLLRPLLTTRTLLHTLAVILLDWTRPWLFLRQLRDWVRMLQSLLASLGKDAKELMEENMSEWRNRRHGGNMGLEGVASLVPEQQVLIPPGPGEWDEPLGIPLCVVCQNADKIGSLDKEHGWREEDFDGVQQFLRTVLLKHGASLIYATSVASPALKQLVFSSLGIRSLFKDTLKHNVIDRDKVIVPPRWDSWGKIQVLREGFDVEAVSVGWSIDIRDSSPAFPNNTSKDNLAGPIENSLKKNGHRNVGAVSLYENILRNPDREGALAPIALKERQNEQIEVESLDIQVFLAQQAKIMEEMGQDEIGEEHLEGAPDDMPRRGESQGSGFQTEFGAGENRVNEHIGPVQLNIGGIQLDADDMINRLKQDRENNRTPELETESSTLSGGKAQNEALATFFAGLMNRGNTTPNGSSR